MKIFISGIAGFVGSNIANQLQTEHTVTGCDTLQFASHKNTIEMGKGLRWGTYNIGTVSEAQLNLNDILILSHCANIIYAMNNEGDTWKNNAFDTIHAIDKFSGKIIYLSTASVYNQADEIPTPETASIDCKNAYDRSKYLVEKYLRLRGNYTTLRLSNVYGINQRPESPYCGVVGKFIHQALNGEHITIIGEGTQTRDFTYVADVVNAVMDAIKLPALNTEINIASGVETSCRELSAMIYLASGNSCVIESIPKRTIDTIDRRCLNVMKAKELLGWSPCFSLEEGIKQTIEWQRNGR